MRLGTAPDSWGVWFAEDPQQTTWSRYLNEVAEAGYRWVELGPYGYLPTDPTTLRNELGRRGLSLSGGTTFAGFHRGEAGLREHLDDCRPIARLVGELGGNFMVVIPEMCSDMMGAVTQSRSLDDAQWSELTTGATAFGQTLLEEFGVRMAFHPHADAHVDGESSTSRFLDGTDPAAVWLCLDVGHFAYAGGNSFDLIERHPARIGYLHIKQVSPGVLATVLADDAPFVEAVRRGVMVEPPTGLPAIEPLSPMLENIDPEMFAIVEQDMYPCSPDHPLPIAVRTRHYLASIGL